MSKKNISPKSYLEKYIFDNIGNISKKIKISDSKFKILKLNEFDKLKKYQFKVEQLKEMCTHYKLKKSGNKNELINRLYNYLKYSLYSIKIQSCFRKYLVKQFIENSGSHIENRNKCINDTDFVSLENITNINFYNFFSFKDDDGNIFGCDIKSFYSLVNPNKSNRFFNNNYQSLNETILNPYNRSEISEHVIKNFKKTVKIAKLLNFPLELVDEEEYIDPKKKFELKIHETFQNINSLGNYADSKWFIDLNTQQLILFIREIYDIWNYRAQLSNLTKREIMHPHGNPFLGIQFQFVQELSITSIKNNALQIIINMISSGINNDSKCLGAYYVLAALTLVSQNARDSLPWLYQSVAHI